MTRDRPYSDSTPPCEACHGNGIVTWEQEDGRYWDVCHQCAAGRAVEIELRKGMADIKAGRLHRWEDVRRNM